MLREPPALVLMDLAMPILDGFAATLQLKADPATRDVPVVALTALAMRSDEERARACGFDSFLTKPIERAAFAGTVARFLGERPPSGPPPPGGTT